MRPDARERPTCKLAHALVCPGVNKCPLGTRNHIVSMHSVHIPGTYACTHVYVRHCSRKPVLQTSVNKQMAPQHYHFTTLQLLLCSCSKHFLACCMKKGGCRGFAKLYISYVICLLNTFGVEGGKSFSIFDLHPAGHRFFPGSQWIFASCLPLSRLL